MRTSAHIAALCLFISVQVFSQDSQVLSDLRLWTGIEIEKSFAKDWTVSLKEELRLKNNMSDINNYFTQLGLQYKINKNFTLGTAYRITRDTDRNGDYRNLARLHFDLKFKARISIVDIRYRLRYQREGEGWQPFGQDEPYEKMFRNRLEIRVNYFKIIKPYTSGEIFQVFSPYLSPQFEYWRFTAGVRIEPKNIGDFKLAWGFNREIGSQEPAMIYMFRVNYTYSF